MSVGRLEKLCTRIAEIPKGGEAISIPIARGEYCAIILISINDLQELAAGYLKARSGEKCTGSMLRAHLKKHHG